MKSLRLAQIALATTVALGVSAPVFAQAAGATPPAATAEQRDQRHAEFHKRHGDKRGEHHHTMKRHHHAKHMAHAGFGASFVRGLDLTEEQRDKLFEIRHASAPKMRDIRKALVKAQRELRNLATAQTFDQAAAQKQADALAQAHSQLALLRAQNTNAMLAVLTPEQRQKMEQRQQKRDDRRKAWREGQRGNPAPAPKAAPSAS